MTRSSPRIYGIPATAAPVVAVIRRGPSDWVHIGAWDTAAGLFIPGAWFRGTIYPQKCDLSPDGRWLIYSAMKVGSDWSGGDVYEAISRLPWLTALAAWNSGTTYTRGMHFVDDPADSNAGDPDVGDPGPCLRRYGLRWTLPEQFSVERRRGWVESDDTPPRGEGEWWDEQRRVVMVKAQPGGGPTLHVEGRYAAFRAGEPHDGEPIYWLDHGGEIRLLEDVQWADWDQRGQLLVATRAGRLESRSITSGKRGDRRSGGRRAGYNSTAAVGFAMVINAGWADPQVRPVLARWSLLPAAPATEPRRASPHRAARLRRWQAHTR